MKKIKISASALIALVICSIVFVACDGKESDKKLSEPTNLTVDTVKKILSWNEVENATAIQYKLMTEHLLEILF